MQIFNNRFKAQILSFVLPAVFVVGAFNGDAQECEGDVVISSQQAVDEFGCGVISGNLIVSDDGIDPISNLNGLEGLSHVSGGIVVQFNNFLTDLDGFSALASIGDFLLIDSNPMLADLQGLSSLQSVGGLLGIVNNNKLVGLGGFERLSVIGDSLFVFGNPELTSLDGLTGLSHVDSFVVMQDNPFLSSYCGLNPLFSAEDFEGRFFAFGNAVNPTVGEVIDDGRCISDSDGDGIVDSEDLCPFSRGVGELLTIGGYHTDIDNHVDEFGCTLNDLIDSIAEEARNHGQFVRGVARLANTLKKSGRISGTQRGTMLNAAARADLP